MIKKIIFVIIVVFIILHIITFKKSIENNLDFKLKSYTETELLNTTDNKIIFSFWHCDDIPLSVKVAIHTWKKHNPDYKICLVTLDTVDNYIDTNDLPSNLKNKAIQYKTDCIRLLLLEKYGGIWIDSTILITKPLTEWQTNDFDIGGYEADFFTTKKDKPVFENWFIATSKSNSDIIKEWKNEFFRSAEYDDINDYINDLEKTIDLQNINGKHYLSMHCAFLKIINNKTYKFKFFPACKNNGPLSYLCNNNWNSNYSIFLFFLPSKNKPLPIYKLRGLERNLLDQYLIFHINGIGGIFDKIIKS